mgnify:CR=1 FL=1
MALCMGLFAGVGRQGVLLNIQREVDGLGAGARLVVPQVQRGRRSPAFLVENDQAVLRSLLVPLSGLGLTLQLAGAPILHG